MQNLNLNNKEQKMSIEDRNKLKKLKREHKRSIIEAGMDPKKKINVEPLNLKK